VVRQLCDVCRRQVTCGERRRYTYKSNFFYLNYYFNINKNISYIYKSYKVLKKDLFLYIYYYNKKDIKYLNKNKNKI
jgi:hypothetical protein